MQAAPARVSHPQPARSLPACAAVQLAALSGHTAQAILDRWQWAVAQQELASLGARPSTVWRGYAAAAPPLQPRGASAGRGAAASDGMAASQSAANGTAAAATMGSAPAAAAGRGRGTTSARDAEAITRRQRRQAAKLAKAAAKAAAKAERREQRLLRRRLRREQRAAAEAYQPLPSQQQQQEQRQQRVQWSLALSRPTCWVQAGRSRRYSCHLRVAPESAACLFCLL